MIFLLFLLDGSILQCEPKFETLKIQTTYGEMKVPVKDIHSIKMGQHIPPSLNIDGAVDKLNSTLFKERDEATNYLINYGRFSKPVLEKRQKENTTDSVEQIKRIEEILRCLKDTTFPDPFDLVETKEMTIKGRIAQSDFGVKNVVLGEIKIPTWEISRVETIDKAVEDFDVQADNKWHQSIRVQRGNKLEIQAEGAVDLWPQGPGQYISRPKGYTTAGKNSPHMAGALIGRIGQDGQTFLIGESTSVEAARDGILELNIVQSPWNNNSTGSYKVRLRRLIR